MVTYLLWCSSGGHSCSSYINDLSYLALSQGAKILLYADDILPYKPINMPSDFDDLQADVNTIAHWISGNHLTVNSSKTKCMLISRKLHISKLTIYLHLI